MLLKTGEDFDLSRGYDCYKNRAFVKFEILSRSDELKKDYRSYEYANHYSHERAEKKDIISERVQTKEDVVYIYHKRPISLSPEDLAILSGEYLGFGYKVAENEAGELLLHFHLGS